MITHLIFVGIIVFNTLSECVSICYDINGKDSDLVSKNEFKAIFTSTASIRPYEDVSIVEVVEDDIILWENDNEGEFCSFIVIFRFEDLVTMLCLKIISGENNYKLHFVKEKGVWEMLEKKDFTEILNDMKSKIPTDKHIMLDIKKPDEEKIKVSRWNTGGSDFITYTTNYPYSTIKIVEGSSVIWRGTYNDDCCIDCAVYLKNENYELLQAFLCADYKVGFKFFSKLNDTWTSLEQEEFYKNLKKLDIAEDSRLFKECSERICKS